MDENLTVYEDMVGLYETSTTDAATLTAIIEDVVLRLNLSFDNLRAQCYDGASNMSGIHTGVQKRILGLQPKALYVHCRNHVLNLALQDAASSVRCVRDVLSLTNDLAAFFRDSAKRTGVLESAISSAICGSTGAGNRLHPLSPTRWTVRARALNALLTHYEAVMSALDQLADDTGPTGAKAAGFFSKLSTFECLFALTIAYKIFSITEQLGTVLQSTTMTLSAAQQSVTDVVDTLQALRSHTNYAAVWQDVIQTVENLSLLHPQMPRKLRPSARYSDGATANPHEYSDCESYHRVESWYAFIDIIVEQIRARFSQQSFQHIVNAEELLLQAAKGEAFDDCLKQFCLFYDDFDSRLLEAQLHILYSTVTKQENVVVSVAGIAETLNKVPGAKILLGEVWRLTKLLLVVPVSAAAAERSDA